MANQPSIDANSFCFKNKYSAPNRRARVIATTLSKKRRIDFNNNAEKSRSNMQKEIEEIQTLNSSNLLENVTLHIDRSVIQRQKLTQIALSMGAQVKDTMDKKTTHIVHGPKKGNIIPKIIKQAAANNICRVSPKWIIQCYKQQVRLGTTPFPYDLDETTGMGLPQASDDTDDPFGIKNRIPDIMERPVERQLGIERFFARQENPVLDNEVQGQTDNEEEDVDDESKRAACELRSKQIEEAIKAKREEIAMNLSKDSTKTTREGSNKIQLQKKKKPTFGVNNEFFEHDGMKIWYGEQSYRL